MNSALVAVGTNGRLVLQAVPRADLVDVDRARQPGPAVHAGRADGHRLRAGPGDDQEG